MSSWDDFSYPVDESVDTAFRMSGLDALDSLFGGGLREQTRQNFVNPDYEQEQVDQAQADEDWQNWLQQRQTRNELSKGLEYEDVPLYERGVIGLGQGALQIGRQIGGLADYEGIRAGRKLANAAQEEYQNLSELTDTPDQNESLSGEFLQWFTNNASSVLPSMAAGYGTRSFAATVAAAGAQTFGSVFEDAQDSYLKRGLDESTARDKARLPAIIAGAVTAALTFAGGRSLIEPGQISFASIREAIQKPVETILKGFGKEAAEEGLDQFSQGIVEQKSYNPDKTWGQIVQESLAAGAAGGLLGGLGESVNVGRLQAARGVRGLQRGQAEPQQNPPGLNSADTEFDAISVPVDELNVPVVPLQLPQGDSGLRRGRQQVSIGARILSSYGFDVETATEFANRFDATNPEFESLEDYREQLLKAAEQAGIVPPESVNLYREDVQSYIDAGQTLEEAAATVQEAKRLNEQTRANVIARNREALNRFTGINEPLTTGEPNAITEREKELQSERVGTNARLQSQRQNRQLTPGEQTQSNEAGTGNIVLNDAAGQVVLSPRERANLQQQQPTEAQKEAGNYKKGHVSIDGLDIAIENVRGSERSGKDKDGETWSVIMPADYGYVKGTKAIDGDNVDIYLGTNPKQDAGVFIIDQINPETGKFDEHKVMYGFPDEQSAIATYDAAFSDGKGPQRRGAVSPVSKEQFKDWLENGNTKVPFAKTQPGQGKSNPVSEPKPFPHDVRRQVKWFNEEAQRLASIDKKQGWEMIKKGNLIARQIIDEERGKIPTDAIAVRIERANKYVSIITRSTKPQFEGKWQVTNFLKDGTPFNDTVYDSLDQAVKNEVRSYEDRVVDVRRQGKKQNATQRARIEERPPDIIDHIIGSIGRIKGKKIAPKGTEGYYGERYKALLGYAALRKVFSNKSGAQNPDEVVDSLRRDGYLGEDATVDDLWDLLEQAAISRKNWIPGRSKENAAIEEMANQTADFQQTAFKRKTKADHIGTEDLLVGDTFKISKQEFVVSDLELDQETGEVLAVIVEDGKRFGTQRVEAGRVLSADINSYHQNEGATDFLPKSERDLTADEVTELDRQINALREKESLTPDEHRQMQLLEQQRGQKFMELNDPEKIMDEAQMREELAADQRQRMLNEANAPLTAPDLRKQQDMLENPDREEMFSRRVGYDRPRASFKEKATGIEQLKVVVENNKDKLPANTYQTILHFLKTPVMQKLDWSWLEIELSDYIAKNVVGSRLGRLIKITTEAPSATLPHEIGHFLFEALPDGEKQILEQSRLESLRESFPEMADRFEQGITSGQFTKMRLSLHPEQMNRLYRHINAGEFYSHLFEDAIAQKAFAERHGTPILNRLLVWFRGMIAEVKRLFGVNLNIDEIIARSIAGKYSPEADAKSDEQLSFRRTAEDAQNAERLSKTVDARITEGHNQLAQSTDILAFLNRHGAASASAATKKAIRFLELLGINVSGERLIGGVLNYAQVKAALAGSTVKLKQAALAAASEVRYFEAHLDEAIQKSTEAAATLARPGFQRKLQRESKLQSEADLTEAINQASGPLLESALKMSLKALKTEAKNDTKIAQLEAQIKEITAAKGSSAAMARLVPDIINVLSSTPEGIALLSSPDPKRADILGIYRDIKRSTGEPLYNDSLQNWAAFILSRNAKLRDALWGAELARNSTIRAGMGAYETKFLRDLERDTKGTILREIKDAQRRQKKEDFAKFAYQALHQDVMQELTEAAQAFEAGDIAQRIKNDRDYQAFRKEAFDDAGVEGRLESFVPGKDISFVLPDGKSVVDISMNGMQGTKVPTERWAQWDAARNELKDWLTNNPDHPDYRAHEKNMVNLEEFYLNESVLHPHDREQIFEGAINTLLGAVRNAGGRFAAVISKLVPRWSFLKEQAGFWSNHWSKELVNQRVKTLKSHGLKWSGQGGKLPIEAVNSNFYRTHLNQVIYSLNRESNPLKVGDRTQSGMTVTKEDLADAKLQHEATKAGFEIVEKNFVRDSFVIDKRTGYVVQRRPGKTAEDMVPRVIEDSAQKFMEEFKAARDEFRAADGDPAKEAAATQKQIDLINKNWEQVAYPYVWDRNPNFAQETPFDGAGGAYEQLAELFETAPGLVSDWDGFIAQLMTRATVTKAEAESIVLADMGRMFENGLQDETGNLIVTPVTGEKKNAFTRARGAEVLPFSFYTYGFQDSRGVHRFSGAIHSRAYEKVLNGLDQLRQDIEDRIAELTKRAQKVGIKQAISERAVQKANGENYDAFNDLDTKLANLKKIIAHMTQPQPEDSVDIWFSRLISGVQGSIIGNFMTTARNVIEGPKFLAAVIGRLNARPIFEFPHVAYQLWIVQGLGKAMPALGKSLALGTIKTVPALGRAIRALAFNKDARFRSAVGEAFAPFLMETSKFMYERQKDVNDMVKRGLDYVPDVNLEFQNKLKAGFLAGGEILPQEIVGKITKTGLGFASIIETFNTPIKGIFSSLGEHALNAGIVRVMTWHRQTMQRALNKVYDAIAAGRRGFDFDDSTNPMNRLDYRELYPRDGTRVIAGEQDLADVEAMYQDAGLSAQTEFWKYLKQRRDGVPSPEYLQGEASNLLANYALGLVNKSTPMSQPTILQGKGFWTTLLKPLMGWSMRTLNFIHRSLAVPASTNNSVADAKALTRARLRQYLFLSSVVLLPMLLAFTANGLMGEEAARLLTKAIWGQERSSRFPWEREGTKSQALGWVINATYGIPFVDMIINTMVNDLPQRASLDPNIIMVNKAKDLANYVGGVVQTGDITFGLPRLIEGFYPDSRIILNRIESETGKRAGLDVVALLRRHGPQDLVKPAGGPMAGPNFTELSPYGQKMENAALNRNWSELRQLYGEAVSKAQELGKDNPERLVKQIYQARNPFTRALKAKISDEQYNDFLSRLDSQERQKVEDVTGAFKEGGELIGTEPTFTQEQRKEGGYVSSLSRAASARRASPASRHGVANKSSLSNLRGTRGRSRNSRLSRSSRTLRRGAR